MTRNGTPSSVSETTKCAKGTKSANRAGALWRVGSWRLGIDGHDDLAASVAFLEITHRLRNFSQRIHPVDYRSQLSLFDQVRNKRQGVDIDLPDDRQLALLHKGREDPAFHHEPDHVAHLDGVGLATGAAAKVAGSRTSAELRRVDLKVLPEDRSRHAQ